MFMPTVDEELAEIEKIREQIDELNVEKARIVRDINIPFFEAKEKAEKIIKEAEAKSESILKAATQIKADADAYSVRVRAEATDFLHIAKGAVKEIQTAKEKLANEKDDFEGYRLASENAIKIKITEAVGLMHRSVNLKKEADDAMVNVSSKQATLSRKESDLQAVEASLNAMAQTAKEIAGSQEKRGQEIASLLKDLNSRESDLAHSLLRFEDLKKEIDRQTENNKNRAAELDTQKTEQEKQKGIITSQFNLLEKSNKDLEEANRALDEKDQLVTIRSREVDQKMKNLNELRSKKQ
jgi:DNA repair exonuclease SbcCD ATPase subunit